MMTSGQIRTAFLDFFVSKEHGIVSSAPIVIKNDPTLMFTNAGMNQFKDYFLGNKKAPESRVADTQKCLRVSGKHNDLEEVGVDTYHHTMFEMLGNWSFGDPANPSKGYFKAEAIEWSWELLTRVYKIPADKLYVTIFEGDEKEGLPKDAEAENEWKKWIAEDRILLGNKKDNFWEMGDTGPCGPCTEIHVDLRSEEEKTRVDGKSLVNADHPQVIEIWNNVFIQYNRLKDGSLQPLPAKHVDTGMGFERLVRVIQGKTSNYDSDVFSGTINKIAEITGKAYTGGEEKPDVAIRVNADHIRAISFTIADGQLPSNTGAGYVIRRILRRAVRYYYSYLNHPQPLLYQLVPVIANQFQSVFPELKSQEAFVAKVIKEEEEAFLRTLEKGLKRIDDIIKSSPASISGKDAFELYDTYGFPFDLTRLIAAEKNMEVDETAFHSEMQKQKERSRAATSVDAEDWTILDSSANNAFIGYIHDEAETSILRFRKVKSKGKEAVQLVLDKTPFYAESGGQAGDSGELVINNATCKVLDTKKENDLIVHIVEKVPEDLSGKIIARINKEKRRATEVHHSATHLLHAALRKVLGTHVAQKGSLVNAENLRFDFSHFSKMTTEEIISVEELVNEKIRENIPVSIQSVPKEEAIASGAIALFGEKYADMVRVVTIDPAYSVELCGGTHAGATGSLGYFKIIGETAVAAGVRRIEAISGKAAEKFIRAEMNHLVQLREQLKSKDPIKAIATLQDENSALKRQVEKVEQVQTLVLRDQLKNNLEEINGINFIGAVVSVASADQLKKLAFELKQVIANHIIILASDIEGKASVVLLFDEAQASARNLDAAALVKKSIAPLISGGGGGQKTLATAGGQDVTALYQVLDTVKTLL